MMRTECAFIFEGPDSTGTASLAARERNVNYLALK